MATIIIPTPLRKFTNQQSKISVEGNTIKEALDDLTLNYPDVKRNLIDENGKIRGFVNIFIEDEDIRSLKEEETTIEKTPQLALFLQLREEVEKKKQYFLKKN